MDIARNGEYWGEPDLVAYNKQKDEYLFVDCSAETPKVVEAFAMTERP